MENIFLAFILCMSLFIAWGNVLKEKINFKNIKVYCLCFICTIITIINYSIATDLFRMINSLMIFIVFSKLLFKKNTKDLILLGIFSLMLMLFAEVIILIIDQACLKLLEVSNKEIVYIYFSNLLTSVLLIIFSIIPQVSKFYYNLVEITKKISEKQVVFFSFFIAIVYNILALITYKTNYHKLDIYYLSLASCTLTVICCIIIYNYLKSQSRYLKINEKYNISLENIKNYENILEKNKINNHENRNQLLAIRNMSKNKKIAKYIDTLVDNKIKDDERLFIDICRIPEGGLRGLIYSKLLIIKNNDIQFELNIDKKINSNKIRKISDSLLIDLCKIIGVILDNAIEEVIKLDDKYITIEFYYEKGYTNISITNNYKGYIDIDIISNPGYTTKKDGRGYGLTLVKELINRHNQLENKIELFEDNFMQTIKIKM